MRFFGKSGRTPNMGPSLPILTIGGLLGAALALLPATGPAQSTRPTGTGHSAQPNRPAELPATPRIHGQDLLEQAILVLEERRSVSAKIFQSVDLFGHQPVGSGIYREERSEGGLRLRLEVRVRLAGQTGGLLHVCDGQYLWRYEKFGEHESLTRIDVGRVREALENSGDMGRINKVGWWPGLGGLSRLLRGLHAAFDFPTVEPTRLGEPPRPVWRLRGRWKPEKLAPLLPGQKSRLQEGKPVDLAALPPHLPDQVVLFLGQNDGFPYQIEYRRQQPHPSQAEDDAKDRAIVTVKLRDVALNASIHPTDFLFNPGDLPIADGTGRFLQDLSLAP
jgi:hypothetical protein